MKVFPFWPRFSCTVTKDVTFISTYMCKQRDVIQWRQTPQPRSEVLWTEAGLLDWGYPDTPGRQPLLLRLQVLHLQHVEIVGRQNLQSK